LVDQLLQHFIQAARIYCDVITTCLESIGWEFNAIQLQVRAELAHVVVWIKLEVAVHKTGDDGALLRIPFLLLLVARLLQLSWKFVLPFFLCLIEVSECAKQRLRTEILYLHISQ